MAPEWDSRTEWHFKVDDTRFKSRIRNLLGRFIKGGNAMRETNRRSIEWLAEHAADNLSRDVHRYRDSRNRVRLVDVVADPKASYWDQTGFKFLVDSRVRAISNRAEAYYRVIEGRPDSDVGSRYWVGRHIRLRFYGPGGVGYQAASYKRGAPEILITNPVPAYHYAWQARRDFLINDKFHQFAADELSKAGIPMKRIPSSTF